MEKFIIGYDGTNNWEIQNYEVIEAKTSYQASSEAYFKAREEWDSYSHYDWDDLLEEADGDEQLAYELEREYRENEIQYTVIPYSVEKEKELEGFNFENPFT